MHILYLTAPGDSRPLLDAFAGHDVLCSSDPVHEHMLKLPHWIVSYGYRHLLPANTCTRFDGRAVNLHIGLLPWNRGAHPNFWSAAEGTPSGVTIHYIDAGIDTGDVIAQQEIALSNDLTLRESYASLRGYAEALFRRWWPELVAGTAHRIPQTGAGSYHRSAELPAGLDWDIQRGMVCGNVFA